MESPEIPAFTQRGPGLIIGLTGAIGSGKSEVGRLFARQGARLVNADEVAREVLYSSGLRPRLLESFGQDILDEAGELSRENIARIVFSNPAKLEQLNKLIHPGVREHFNKTLKELKAGEIFIYDVPLLFESGLADDFDLIIVVSAPLEIRQERVFERNGWTKEEFLKREASQIPLSEKEKQADLIIRNSSSRADLQAIIQKLYKDIKEHMK